MIFRNFRSDIKRLIKKLDGSTIEYDLSGYSNFLNKINTCHLQFEKYTDKQLTDLSASLKDKIRNGEDPDSLVVPSFALVKEAVRRILNITPFDCQLTAGLCLNAGRLIEMNTGEGKTLCALFPAYLNALSGKGVHILTFNDYLAKRDALWMGPVFNFLGLSAGFISGFMKTNKRQNAYNMDITYLTAKEAGFDYLRDNQCCSPRRYCPERF